MLGYPMFSGLPPVAMLNMLNMLVGLGPLEDEQDEKYGPGREFSSLRDPSSNDNGFGDGNFNENKINSIGNGEGGMSKPHIPGHSGTINSYLDDTCLNCLTKCETEGRIFHDHISCQNECCPKGVFVEPYVRTAHEAPRPPNLFTYLHGA